MDFGGEGGIRTLGKLLTHTRFPGVLLKPLGHLSRHLANRVRAVTRPADPRHPNQLLPLLPSGPDGFGNLSSRGAGRIHHRGKILHVQCVCLASQRDDIKKVVSNTDLERCPNEIVSDYRLDCVNG